MPVTLTEEDRLLESIFLDALDEHLVTIAIHDQRTDVRAEPRPVGDDESPAVREPLDGIVVIRSE